MGADVFPPLQCENKETFIQQIQSVDIEIQAAIAICIQQVSEEDVLHKSGASLPKIQEVFTGYILSWGEFHKNTFVPK